MMRLPRAPLALFFAVMSLVPTVRGQDGKESLPLEVRLIAKRTVYPAAKADSKTEDRLQCFVAMDVELKNIGKEALDLLIAPEPELILTGPRPESVRKVSGARYYVYQERRLSIGAGKTHRITLRTLTYRVGAAQYGVLWQEPGEYQLQAVYRVSDFPRSGEGTPEEKKAALRTAIVRSSPLKLTIQDGPVVDYWADTLADRDKELRGIALQNLTDMGPVAAPAGTKLVGLLADENAEIRIKAAHALASIGPKGKTVAMPGLLKSLKDSDLEVRRTAISALSHVAPAEKEVASAVLPFLRDKDPKTRIAAAEAFRHMPFNGHEVKPAETKALLAALKAEDVPDVRRNIIATLCHHPQLEVLAALVPYITCDEKYTRFEALYALGRMVPFLDRDRKKNEALGRPIEKAVEALAAALKDKEALPHAAYALGYFGLDAASAVPALLEALDDPAIQSKELFGHPRVSLIQALRGIGPGAKAATKSLAWRLLTDPDWSVRQYSAQALASIGPDAKDAGPALNQAFQDKMVQVRNEVAPALAKIGALDALLDGLNNDNPETRSSVIQALGGMKEQAKRVVPALSKQLQDDKHAPNRRNAAYALGTVGSATAVPSLIKALKDTNAEVRLAASDALRSIGPDARAAIGPLFDLVSTDKVEANREKAGWALVTINVKGEKSFVPALVKLLSDRNHGVILPVIYLLGQVGPDAAEARPVLARIAQTQKGQLADAAREALRSIEGAR